eukprot:gnl/Dysnectes_brevis/1179_a1316_2213.p1 GENE.gnl/Dysnectes_brevis/1179_a1316_2213~~gnl/Dysnectes_brevis/1179_a1316_2213.p1  ORF type:complete len:354 (+),score=93.27 gnl/Dysnectes_brevis/1179_a1316_2213:519-1580(+)
MARGRKDDEAFVADSESDRTDDFQEGQQEEAAQVIVRPLSELQSVGIGVADLKKLKDAGIYSVGAIKMTTRKHLVKIKGLSDAKIDKILAAVNKLGGEEFCTGAEYLAKRERVIKISTGSSDFDRLLGGGVESMSITEAFGEFRTGKTQICHTLAVTAQLGRSQGGAGGKVMYIDTEGTFRPARLEEIANRYGLDPASVLDNIIYARVFTHEQQIDILTHVAAKMSEEYFGLLIVDSITALFRVDFQGRGELAERQQKLARYLSRLIKLAEEYNVAVFITNQVMSQVDGAAMFTSDPKKPIGGHILAHASTTRLYLRKGRGDTRIAKIYDSPNLPEEEATYAITGGGISDADA